MSKKVTASELPPDVLPEDCKFGRYITDPDNEEEFDAYYAFRKVLRDRQLPDELLFYHIPTGPGWVLCTLKISSAGKRHAPGTPDRYYAIGLKDGKTYTVGRGPHVKSVLRVYFRRDNWERLEKYATLWETGMANAGTVRDRISSRRAQGQQHRAAGRSFWTW